MWYYSSEEGMKSNKAVAEENSISLVLDMLSLVLAQYFGENVKRISQSYSFVFLKLSCSQLIMIIQ